VELVIVICACRVSGLLLVSESYTRTCLMTVLFCYVFMTIIYLYMLLLFARAKCSIYCCHLVNYLQLFVVIVFNCSLTLANYSCLMNARLLFSYVIVFKCL